MIDRGREGSPQPAGHATWSDAAPWTFQRPEWHARAACRGTDPDLFFPKQGQMQGELLAFVRKLCASCPVKQECLDHSFHFNGHGENMGIWGGLTQRDRERIIGKRKNKVRGLTNEQLGIPKGKYSGGERECSICGDVFQPTATTQRYCDNECAEVSAIRRRAARYQVEKRAHRYETRITRDGEAV